MLSMRRGHAARTRDWKVEGTIWYNMVRVIYGVSSKSRFEADPKVEVQIPSKGSESEDHGRISGDKVRSNLM